MSWPTPNWLGDRARNPEAPVFRPRKLPDLVSALSGTSRAVSTRYRRRGVERRTRSGTRRWPGASSSVSCGFDWKVITGAVSLNTAGSPGTVGTMRPVALTYCASPLAPEEARRMRAERRTFMTETSPVDSAWTCAGMLPPEDTLEMGPETTPSLPIVYDWSPPSSSSFNALREWRQLAVPSTLGRRRRRHIL